MVLPGVHLAGRSEEAGILLADESISRNHARIHNTEQGLFIEDLGSSNGTYVQGRRIEGRVPVGMGEEVRLGAVTFRMDPEVGAAGGLGEALAGTEPVPVEQMQRRTNKITAEELDAAKVKKATARQVPAAPLASAPSAPVKFPGSSLFNATPAPAAAGAAVPAAAAAPVPEPAPRGPWFAGGLALGVVIGVAVGWWLARM